MKTIQFYIKNIFLISFLFWNVFNASAQRDLAAEFLASDNFDPGWQKGISLLPDSLSGNTANTYFKGGVLKIMPPRFLVRLDTFWEEDSLPIRRNSFARAFSVRMDGNCMTTYELRMDMHLEKGYRIVERDSFILLETKIYQGMEYEWLPAATWDSIRNMPIECVAWHWRGFVEDDEGNTYVLFPKGHYGEWRGAGICHCGMGFSPKVVAGIQNALRRQGYELEPSETLDTPTKAALVRFQKKRGFPVGTLNRETLCALGLKL